ncbi:hypothetical protein BDR04DRAFT_952161, partial [Suillus decipiens]
RIILKLHQLGHQCHLGALTKHAEALEVRFVKCGNINDIDESIQLRRNTVSLCHKGHPDHGRRRTRSLSSALLSRFWETRMEEDIKEAIGLFQQSLKVLPSLHPERCLGSMQLQAAYRCRYQILHNAPDLSFAVENFGLASRHSTQGFP